jgi:hypothetical protein
VLVLASAEQLGPNVRTVSVRASRTGCVGGSVPQLKSPSSAPWTPTTLTLQLFTVAFHGVTHVDQTCVLAELSQTVLTADMVSQSHLYNNVSF